MINTLDFVTKTTIIDRKNPNISGIWLIGLDIGYSAVKGMSNNKLFSFPAFAAVANNLERFAPPLDTDIQYRGEDGIIWDVGKSAYQASSAADSEAELYGRSERYYSDVFKVIARTGLALGVIGNPIGKLENEKIVLQTGLPPKYKDKDERILQEVLSGKHDFEIRIGKKGWRHISIDINENDIKVMSQPVGALVSACVLPNGEQTEDMPRIFSSHTMVFDPGYGTLDGFSLNNQKAEAIETYPNLGMREVFARTTKDIQEKYGVYLEGLKIQEKLEKGEIRVLDRKTRTQEVYNFASILEKNAKAVCNEALDKMFNTHDFNDYDYIIVTGGTYDAWKEYFDEEFKNIHLSIIPANRNEEGLSNIFSNVRGYYFQRYNILKRRNK